MSKKIHEEILDVLKKHSKIRSTEYINPYFINVISKALLDYYDIEDDEVYDWIQDLFGQ